MENYFTGKNTVNNKENEKTQYAHILLVDDEVILVKLWKCVLEKSGYKVTSYTEGMLALEAFRKKTNSFDIVITDYSMPVINGRELASELFKIRSDVKIILCTGYLENANNENPLGSGILELLVKPFDNNTLIKAIERNLKRK